MAGTGGDPQEIWRPINWAPGYEVSSVGRVRSLDREVAVTANKGKIKRRSAHVKRRKGRVLRLGIGRYASAVVAGRCCLVHRLVAEAFIGPCPEGHIVCHGPGGPLDNCLENLSYGTPSQNNGADRLRDGTLPRGERSGSSRLTETQVIAIKRRLMAGESRASLGREFGVRPENISHIAVGRSWGWLEVAA
jgi:hypothetical protein